LTILFPPSNKIDDFDDDSIANPERILKKERYTFWNITEMERSSLNVKEGCEDRCTAVLTPLFGYEKEKASWQ
jgi:hypothetical protein